MSSSPLRRASPAAPRTCLVALAAPRVLAGPSLDAGAESLESHLARLGHRPFGGAWLVDAVDRSGLRGRGGAWFPTARKWRAVGAASRQRGAIVVVNASEGEILSQKDRTLVRQRPHLVIDGALLAAESVGADHVLVHVSRPSGGLRSAVADALRERRHALPAELPVHITDTPHRYVAGESSAVVRRINGGPAMPSFAPPHPSEAGIAGRPTLVQNAETLAHVALIARLGDAWFRERGIDDAPGTTLLTLSGHVRSPGVIEVDVGAPLTDVLGMAGGSSGEPSGALVGGYFGGWIGAAHVQRARLQAPDVTLGCGVVGVLGPRACGIAEAARVMRYLARESAGQCGPCRFGLADVAGAMDDLAAGVAAREVVARLRRWAGLVAGRGACRHPDGAVHNMLSALDAFAADVERHLDGRPCAGPEVYSLAAPARPRWWRR